jgi:hypothetical protein
VINLRYHIVSLTAVFLALAIGVAVGTTFLNKATVDQLNRQIRSAERGIEDTNARNTELRRDAERADQADEAFTAAAGRLLDGELTDAPVLVVASEGVDTGSLDRLRQALVEAGADLRGTVTVTDRLRLDRIDDEDLATLAEVVKAPLATRAELQARAVDAFATALGEAADRSAGSTASAPALVQRMIDADLLSFQAPDDDTIDATTVLAGGGYRYVVVSGPDPRTPDADFLLPVLRDLAADGPVPAVLASAAVGAEAESTRTVSVGPVRQDTLLRDEVSTVDDLEQFHGLVATVYALADLADGRHGHYGFGDGAVPDLPEGR